MAFYRHFRCAISSAPFLFILLFASFQSIASTASDIENLTEGHTKIVWCHAVNTGGGEPVEEHHEIRAFDTHEGSERVLVPNNNFHFNPIITPSGNEVVYNEGMIINGNTTVNMGTTRVISWKTRMTSWR